MSKFQVIFFKATLNDFIIVMTTHFLCLFYILVIPHFPPRLVHFLRNTQSSPTQSSHISTPASHFISSHTCPTSPQLYIPAQKHLCSSRLSVLLCAFVFQPLLPEPEPKPKPAPAFLHLVPAQSWSSCATVIRNWCHFRWQFRGKDASSVGGTTEGNVDAIKGSGMNPFKSVDYLLPLFGPVCLNL